jgi:proteic killer suppression protein
MGHILASCATCNILIHYWRSQKEKRELIKSIRHKGLKKFFNSGGNDTRGINYAIWVSGNWRMTFEFENGDAYVVDYEDYH